MRQANWSMSTHILTDSGLSKHREVNWLTLILKPAFALVSMNITLNSRALASPSSIDTCLDMTSFHKGFEEVEWAMWGKITCHLPPEQIPHNMNSHVPHEVGKMHHVMPTPCFSQPVLQYLYREAMWVCAEWAQQSSCKSRRWVQKWSFVGCRGGHLLSTRSVLLPTRTMMTSLPLSVRTSSIQRAVFTKDCRSVRISCNQHLAAKCYLQEAFIFIKSYRRHSFASNLTGGIHFHQIKHSSKVYRTPLPLKKGIVKEKVHHVLG